MNRIKAEVKQGILQGCLLRTIYGTFYIAFTRVPFAAPPIGNLRFKDPHPPDGWEGIRYCNDYRNAYCIQRVISPSENIIGAEDCLYLNVYVPFRIRKETGKAVMVWIHGGNFSNGAGNFNETRPDYLLEKDIILVTINYRFGAFGFLNLDHVVASGNQGLKDQVAALQWIKDNIAVFGGDPNNVTVFGSNVGAVCAHLLTISPLSTNLCHKAILQGGVATMTWAMDDYATVNRSYKLAMKLGCTSSKPEDIVEFLNKKSANDIIKAQHSLLPSGETNMCRIIFGPSIDKSAESPFLPCPPHELLHNGNHKPVILGHTSYEYLRFFDGSTSERLDALYFALPLFVRTLLPREASVQQAQQLTDRFQKCYFNKKWPKHSSLPPALRCYSDIYFNIPIKMVADERRKLAEAPTYVYEFSYVGNQKIINNNLYWYNVNLPVTSQDDDLPYLFFHAVFEPNISPPQPETDDFKIVQIMTSMWINFAKTGDPIPVKNIYTPIKWKPVTKENFYYLDIDKQLQLRDHSSTIAHYSTLLGT